MNLPTTQATMTSLELVQIINNLREEGQAELRHDTFTAKIRKVLGDKAPEFSGALKTPSGQTALGYILPKRECHLMVMSESYKVQAAVYDRMTELEAQATKSNFDPANLTRMQLIQLALEAEQELQIEKAINAELRPKAKALDRISGSEGSQCITDTAKALKIPPRKLFEWLQNNRWIYKRAGGKNWLGYQKKIQTGYVEHKITTVEKSDGSEKVVEQALITPKGIAKISTLLA